MVTRTPRSLVLALLVGAVACKGDGPTAPRPSVPLQLCIAENPWVAYRNEGGGWTRVLASGGTFAFDATERVSLAVAWDRAYQPYLMVEQASAAQLAAQHSCTPRPAEPPTAISGVVRSLGTQSTASLKYAGGSAYVFGSDSTFRLPASAEPRDLVAVRMPPNSADGQLAERIIVRRGQTLAAGTSLVIDFAAPEAMVPDRIDLAWTGPAAGVSGYLGGTALAPGTWIAGIGATVDPMERARTSPFVMLPAAIRQAGDLHHVVLDEATESGTTTARQLDAWANDPRTLQLRFGAIPAAPSFRTLATMPALRVRGDVPYQADYAGSVQLYLSQDGTNPPGTMLAVTREYLASTPGAWRLEVPDLRRLAGYPVSVSLADAPTRYVLRLTSIPGLLPFARAEPRDGEVARTATRTGIAR